MHRDPGQAVPVLERILTGNSSERVKARALFVLSQSDSPRAREILLRIARTGQPAELRREAVRTLGIAGDPTDVAALAELARDQKVPEEIREAVIEAFLISGQTGPLVEMAKSDLSPRIRAKAIEALGVNGEGSALRQLWGTERDPALRAKLLESFGIAGDVDALTKAARDSDPRLRQKAIEGLGIAGGPEAGKALRQLYRESTQTDDRRKIAEAFMIQGDAQTLLELFRAERDPAMKKVLLQHLSMMDEPEATQVILDVLGEKP
jgi:HEAT repeat protein